MNDFNKRQHHKDDLDEIIQLKNHYKKIAAASFDKAEVLAKHLAKIVLLQEKRPGESILTNKVRLCEERTTI